MVVNFDTTTIRAMDTQVSVQFTAMAIQPRGKHEVWPMWALFDEKSMRHELTATFQGCNTLQVAFRVSCSSWSDAMES